MSAERPPQRTLLRFWAPESLKAEPQEWVGWWDGRRFYGAFGDGAWSPYLVTRWEPLREATE